MLYEEKNIFVKMETKNHSLLPLTMWQRINDLLFSKKESGLEHSTQDFLAIELFLSAE